MADDDSAILTLFKECLGLGVDAVSKRLDAVEPQMADKVRALLAADADDVAVADGFGAGALAWLSDRADPTQRDVLPASIGPYRVIRAAGMGATAVVYEAEEDVPRRRVAVKVARATLDPDLHQRFVEEAHALATVRDPAIPVVYQVGSVAGLPWLGMEWVEGETIQPKLLPDPAPVFRDIAKGLSAAHGSGVSHGDLSAANVLMTARGPKVVDFGLTRQPSDRSLGGTPGYVSPARLTPEQADQYALGCLMEGVQGPPDLLAIAGCAKDVGYPDMRTLCRDLQAVCDDARVSVVPETFQRQLARTYRRHRWGLTVAGIAGLTLLALGSGATATRQALARQGERQRQQRAEEALSRSDSAEDIVDWLADPAHQGTPAVSHAWLSLASHYDAQGDDASAEDAAAQALVMARDPLTREQAGHRIARSLRREGRWASLGRLADMVDTPSTELWRAWSRVGSRDLSPIGDTSIDGVLAEWRQQTRGPVAATSVARHGTDLLAADSHSDSWMVLRSDASLEVLHRASLDRGQDIVAPLDGYLEHRLDEDTLVLSAVAADNTLLEVATYGDGAHDLARIPTNDGDRLFLAMGYPERDLVELAETVVPVHRRTTMARSDNRSVMAATLPDGSWGLVAGLGAWFAYDLRLLPVDELEAPLLAREQLGTVTALASLSDAEGLLVAAGKSDQHANPMVFHHRSRYGATRGVYLRSYAAGDWIDEGFVSGADVFSEDDWFRELIAADFDGDGDEDLVGRLDTVRGPVLWLLVQAEDGWHDIGIDGLIPMAAVELDGDKAVELVVADPRNGDQLWVLGAGDDTLGALPSDPSSTLALSDGPLPPALAGFEVLTGLGLYASAARFAEDAARTATPEVSARARELAGHAWLEAGDMQRAYKHLYAAVEAGAQSGEATAMALLHTQWRLLDVDGARKTLERTDARAADSFRQRIDGLVGYPQSTVMLPRDLDRVELDRIEQIRSPLLEGAWVVDTIRGGGTLLRIPVARAERYVGLSIQVTAERLERGAGVMVGFAGVAEVGLWGFGGAESLWMRVGCFSDDEESVALLALDDYRGLDRTVNVSLTWDTATGEMRCAVDDGRRQVVDEVWRSDAQLADGLPVTVRAHEAGTERGSRATVRLDDLSLAGIHLADPQPSPLQATHRAHLRGEYSASIEGYTSLGLYEWVTMAELDAGQLPTSDWLSQHPQHPMTARLHRLRPEVAPILASALPDQYPSLVLDQLDGAITYYDSPDVFAILLDPALSTLTPTDSRSCKFLVARAKALVTNDRLGPALASYDRVIAADLKEDKGLCEFEAREKAAVLAARMGRVDDARARVSDLVVGSPAPDITADWLRGHPVLGSLLPHE